MQCSITPAPVPAAFAPFTLNITIETSEELVSLWYRLAMSVAGRVSMRPAARLLERALRDRGLQEAL